jgi:hypothetical protein
MKKLATKQNRMALSFDKVQMDIIEKHAKNLEIPPPQLIYSCMRVATEFSSFYGQIGVEGNLLLKTSFFEFIKEESKKLETPEQQQTYIQTLIYMNNFFEYMDGLLKLEPFSTEWKFVNKFK